MKKNALMKRILAIGITACVLVPVACAPVLETQKQRFDYLHQKINEDIQNAAGCQTPILEHKQAEKIGDAWFDFYVVKGCGEEREYQTLVRQFYYADGAKGTSSQVGFVPSELDYQKAATAHVDKTAQFALECNKLDLVLVSSNMAIDRQSFEGAVGASGCEKRSIYTVSCKTNGLEQGRHKLVCTSKLD